MGIMSPVRISVGKGQLAGRNRGHRVPELIVSPVCVCVCVCVCVYVCVYVCVCILEVGSLLVGTANIVEFQRITRSPQGQPAMWPFALLDDELTRAVGCVDQGHGPLVGRPAG